MKSLPIRLVFLRWAISGALLLVAVGWVGSAAGSSETAMVGYGLFAAAAMILAVIVISPEAVTFATAPLTGWIDRLYFGDNWRTPPQLDLRLARAYSLEGRLEDAAGEYSRHRESHPGNVELLIEGITTLRMLGEEKEAARWLHAGLRRVKAPGDRARMETAMRVPVTAPVDRFY